MARQVVSSGGRIAYEERKQIEVVSAARDPLRAVVGSSGYTGDYASQFIPVLTQPGPQLYLLVSLRIPAGWVAVFRGWRFYAAIGVTQLISDGGAVTQRPYPRYTQLVTAGWGFPDSYLNVGLRLVRGSRLSNNNGDANRGPGMSPNLYPMETTAIYKPGTNPKVLYVAGNNGVFPGEPVGGLGMLYDVAHVPWQTGTILNYEYACEGPAYLGVYVYLNQSNPNAESPSYRGPPPSSTAGVDPPENVFWSAYAAAQWYRLGAAMDVDLIPTKAKTSPTSSEPAP